MKCECKRLNALLSRIAGAPIPGVACRACVDLMQKEIHELKQEVKRLKEKKEPK